MTSKRLLSLDTLRGITVACMIFVNNGAGGDLFAPLRHSVWNGMTLCDVVFPFFLFIMGISTYLSLMKANFRWTPAMVRKILKRTVVLFFIGVAINWFGMACEGQFFDFAHLRIFAVMQRIALSYAAVSSFGLTSFIYGGIHSVVSSGYWSSFIHSSLFVAMHVGFGYPLYRKHIFIKL